MQVFDKAGRLLLVTQIAFPETISSTVCALGVNTPHSQPNTINVTDNVCNDSIANEPGALTGNLADGISKSNLAYANENRDWRIFVEYAYILIAHARKICTSNNDFELKIEGNVYAIDSTTIDLCLNVFWWAKFRKNKGAVKVYTQYDVKTDIPTFIYISDGSVDDVHFMDIIDYEPGGYYILDRGYVDFKRLYPIHQSSAFFGIRLKENTNYRRLYSAKFDKSTGI